MLMLIPTEADLLQQSVQRMCMDKESEEIGRPFSDSIINSTWTQILQSSSSRVEDHLSAAVQIIDNLLQPAPGMLLAPELQQYQQKSVKSNKLLFRNTFILWSCAS